MALTPDEHQKYYDAGKKAAAEGKDQNPYSESVIEVLFHASTGCLFLLFGNQNRDAKKRAWREGYMDSLEG